MSFKSTSQLRVFQLISAGETRPSARALSPRGYVGHTRTSRARPRKLGTGRTNLPSWQKWRSRRGLINWR